MRRTLKLFPALALLAAAGLAFAAEKPPGMPKAGSIDELAKIFDVSACRECHAQIFTEWENSLHARSLVGTPRTMATIRTTVEAMMGEWKKSGVKTVEDVTVEHMWSCAKCHLSQIKYGTDNVARQIAKAAMEGDEETLNKVSINCLICHNEKALIYHWVEGWPEKNVLYGSKSGAHPGAFTRVEESPVMKESIMCGQCHGLGPNFEMKEPTQCATLYGSYLHAYVPSGENRTCQDCHMREHNKGHLMPAYRDPEMARSTVEVDIKTLDYYFLPKAGDLVPMAVVNLIIQNRAGHRVPDG